MSNIFSALGYVSINQYEDKITTTLSSYIEKRVADDGSVSYREVKTKYFLENNKWDIDFLETIPQFRNQVKDYKYNNRTISFSFNNSNINKEIKFIVYSKLFSDKWGVISLLMTQKNFIRRLATFINENYSNLNSILDLGLHKVKLEWTDWLNSKNIKTVKTIKYAGREFQNKTSISNFLELIYKTLLELTDEREEWLKDSWDVRNLEQYGITYNKSQTQYFIHFTNINNIRIRKEVKKYIKKRLIANHKFSWSTVMNYMKCLPNFINYICDLEPTWNDLKGLERHHIEKYLEYLNIYSIKNLTNKNTNFQSYITSSLLIIKKFLSDIQAKEYSIAPIKDVRILIFPSDKPLIKKKPYDQIDYIPDTVLEQLFDKINNLHKEVIPVVWTMYKTGLRISDVLGLKQDCLIKLNNRFWIEADIEKTYVHGHRIPIDTELANILAVLIKNSKENSNQDNNPENYIFVRYRGNRKGKPYSRSWIQDCLNLLAMNYNITDELGNIYHFKNHGFRHTYGIKMLNGGADILTVQDLLAHASPEMTIKYARLLDDTKRRVFDNAIKQGVFHFDYNAKLKEENNVEISTDILNMLWTNHKLNAIDTPYGTCLQRTKGKCTFALQPPCLTCNTGKPCKDLCIGVFEGDIHKYQILINSTESLIDTAKAYDRKDMIKENEELLVQFKEIHSTISEGNIIYGRLDRLKKKGEYNE
jgi:integrase